MESLWQATVAVTRWCTRIRGVSRVNSHARVQAYCASWLFGVCVTTIDVAVRDGLHAGAHPIVIVPGVLFSAAHAKNDLPTELHWLQHTFPEAKFSFASALDLHPRLLQLCAQRIIEAEGAALAKDG